MKPARDRISEWSGIRAALHWGATPAHCAVLGQMLRTYDAKHFGSQCRIALFHMQFGSFLMVSIDSGTSFAQLTQQMCV
jgi:hypothetical protein